MANIETEHNGHKIRYAENEDIWRCWEMDVEGKTLSAVKEKINKLDAEARRTNMPVIVLHHYGIEVEAMGVATLIDGPKTVWVTSKDRRGGTQRRKMDTGRILLDTPENRNALKAALAKRKQGEAITKEADEMVARLPRVNANDLKSLSASQETPKP